MQQRNKRIVGLWCLLVVAAGGCGGGGGSGTPMNQTPPPMAPPNEAPTLSSVPDQTIDEDGVAGPIEISVGDAETDPSDLDLSASAADGTLLPADGIELAGEGAGRTLILIPAAGQSGATDVTVTVTDADGSSSSSSFQLAVNPLVRAEFSAWMRGRVLGQGEFDEPVGALHEDGSPLGELEDILRIKFSDETAEEPAAYDDLLPEDRGE